MTENKVVTLVNEWAAYEVLAKDKSSLEDFCRFYLSKSIEDKKITETAIELRGELLGLMGRMGSFAKHYMKKALQPVGLSMDEWLYLLLLYQMGKPKKSELIYAMLSEFGSGTDLIKRLLKDGFALEFDDEQDRRSKRLQITPKGKEALFQSFDRTNLVGEMAFEGLNTFELSEIYTILKKQETLHDRHFKKFKNMALEDYAKELVAK